MMRKAERGTVIVLTLAGLTAILGVIGLAIDLGLMFDYKQRAQIAADAAALAATLNPTDSEYMAAAREMAEKNGFKNGDGTISVTPVTPPVTGDHTGAENKNKYFEVTISESFPATFLKMIGIKDLPIAVRAVAGIGGGGGYCLTLGSTEIISNHGNHGTLEGENCKFNFASLDNQGTISADTINIKDGDIGSTKVDPSMPLPPVPGTFPASSQFACTKESECKNETLKAGCYRKIKVENNCFFDKGEYYIEKELKFIKNAKATGSGVTFFLNTGSDLYFPGTATLTSGAPGFADVLFWSKGSEMIFGDNEKGNDTKLELTGQIYAPGVPVTFQGGTYTLKATTPSAGPGGLVE